MARVGLLGATAGIGLGLIEAACLRSSSMPLALQRPHVPPSFWLFAPLLASIVFGLLGLLAGCLAALPKSRFLGMLIIGGLTGLMGDYVRLVLQHYPWGGVWFIFLREIMTPSLVFALVFAGALAFLWATRKPTSPLGALADIKMRPWSLAVFASIAAMAAPVGIGALTDHFSGTTVHATAGAHSPNIVLIVLDTTRADHFSSYGYFRNTTPEADEFSRHGVLFENAISASSWTLPAMASIFTSLLPHQHGAGSDFVLGNGPRTLAELLGVGGYETAGFNANPHFGVAPCGLARGFETYIDSTTTLGYSLDATRIGHDFIEPYSEAWFQRGRFNQFNARELNQQVYRWFDHRSDRPFFLFVQYNDAHDPYEVPSPYDHLYGQMSRETKHQLQEAKLGRFDFPADQRKSLTAAYDNALRYTDSQVGELLRFLEHSPQWSNTYVIITADHGEAFGEHHTYSHGWDLYREVLHVPLIVVGPGIPAGGRIGDIARTRQIFATALEFAGAKGAVLHQSSLSRLWTPGYQPTTPDEPTLSEVIDPASSSAPPGMISITTRDWHFICYAGRHRSRLYHWPTDSMEERDVSELPENQAIVKHLKSTILSMIESSYRPWRDDRYLLPLTEPDFRRDIAAHKAPPPASRALHFPQGAGAVQSLFPQNSETPQINTREPDDGLLRSLPYGSEP